MCKDKGEVLNRMSFVLVASPCQDSITQSGNYVVKQGSSITLPSTSQQEGWVSSGPAKFIIWGFQCDLIAFGFKLRPL